MKDIVKTVVGRVAHRVVNGLTQQSTNIVNTDASVEPALADLCRQAATEGIVLLTNDGTLPLGPETRVALFGRVQDDWFTVGYGSGGDVKPPYQQSLAEALGEGPITLDEKLRAAYSTWSSENVPDEGHWGHWPRHFEEMPLESNLVDGAAERCDVAVIVVGRAAGEDRENVLEPGSYYLTDDERHMCDAVMSRFQRTIVVVNTGNVMDMSWAQPYGTRLSALVLAWQGGMESARALTDILLGVSTPSGRLTSTIARRYEDYPSAGNFGDQHHSNYVEDIFVGYRYFETFARDAVMFPFGHGLSYTSFSHSNVHCDVVDGQVYVDVDVTNLGSRYSAKDVVQLYFRAPGGELGTAERSLAAFAKTGELAPGDTQRAGLQFPVADMASYDDGGVTGHRSAWVLQPGRHEFLLGRDVRSAEVIGSYDVDQLEVVTQLEEACAVAPESQFQRMVRTHEDDGAAGPRWEAVPVRSVDLRRRILDTLPEALSVIPSQPLRLDDVARGVAPLEEFVAQLTPGELEALSRGDIRMNSPLGAPGNAGVLGGVSEALRTQGVPPVTCTDGPSGIRLSAYAALLPCGTALASSWNVDLVRSLAAEHGREMVKKGSDVLLSPGMNIHRDPLCGRNFEYFSEDPLITGRMGAAVVSGVQSQDVSACPKHFAVNNQETNRSKSDSRVSERALREIYLKGFEICLREADPHTIMTSYNKINGVWAHYNHELATTILREQWGWDGLVMTDWWMQPSRDPEFPELWDSAYRVRAQVDVLMPGSTIGGLRRGRDRSLLASLEKQDGVTLAELQRTAVNVLRFVMRSQPFTRRQKD